MAVVKPLPPWCKQVHDDNTGGELHITSGKHFLLALTNRCRIFPTIVELQ